MARAQSSASSRPAPRAHEVEGQRRGEKPDRAHHPRAERRQERGRAERQRDPIGVHRPRAAEGEEREAVRVFAALQRMDARGVGHVLVGDLVNAPGRLLDRHAQLVGDLLLDRPPRAVDIQLHAPAEEVGRVKIAEDQIGVGHRRLGSAAPVADRPWIRPGRVRPDLEQPERIHARDRAAAGADLDHLDHRDLDGQPGAFLEAIDSIDLELMGDQRAALVDHTEFGRRAAHVERQQVGVASGLAIGGRRQRARRRAGLEQAHRVAHGGVHGGNAAAGEHEEEIAAEAERWSRASSSRR